jgi:hypothetical protein
MKSISTLSCAALLALACAAQAAEPVVPMLASADQKRSVTPEDFAVYVDQETGFAFIKTPVGWKFIRRIEAEKLALVPPEYFVRIDQRDGALLAQSPKR